MSAPLTSVDVAALFDIPLGAIGETAGPAEWDHAIVGALKANDVTVEIHTGPLVLGRKVVEFTEGHRVMWSFIADLVVDPWTGEMVLRPVGNAPPDVVARLRRQERKAQACARYERRYQRRQQEGGFGR